MQCSITHTHSMVVMESTLAEFHHHATNYDISDECSSICIPESFIGVDSQRGSRAFAIPPSFPEGASSNGFSIVVLIWCSKLHPIGDMIWINWCGNCISSVSAESRHAQTVLVGLWSDRKWRILRRIPQSSVSLNLKTQLSIFVNVRSKITL